MAVIKLLYKDREKESLKVVYCIVSPFAILKLQGDSHSVTI